jgi:hypothetical protein
MINKTENVMKFIQDQDLVLDVGGGAAPFSRADAVVDMLTYDSFLAHQSELSSYRFNRQTWFTGDICASEVWSSIPDKAYDFAVCSHTLEDVRDPLYVCSQLIRVAKSGYIETPSRFREGSKTEANDLIIGWGHHRWFIEVENGSIYFKQKNPELHHFDFLGEERRQHAFDYYKQFTGVYWKGSFDYAERIMKGPQVEVEDLFYFYDNYPYDQTPNFDAPPLLYTIESVPYRGKSIQQTHEYIMPIERVYSLDQIQAMYDQRLETEYRLPKPPPSKTIFFMKRVYHRVRRLIP